eukprot:TRINITY_DN256_c0_g2_i1.p1 TRINITY_DN256_c0_g2~~TRINITY_DN256_c0_g2_i1.p1  ORF type:complete len:332 (+),score=106.84 TRINITY_DN256_c0_g2_i1:36-1031(+)
MGRTQQTKRKQNIKDPLDPENPINKKKKSKKGPKKNAETPTREEKHELKEPSKSESQQNKEPKGNNKKKEQPKKKENPKQVDQPKKQKKEPQKPKAEETKEEKLHQELLKHFDDGLKKGEAKDFVGLTSFLRPLLKNHTSADLARFLSVENSEDISSSTHSPLRRACQALQRAHLHLLLASESSPESRTDPLPKDSLAKICKFLSMASLQLETAGAPFSQYFHDRIAREFVDSLPQTVAYLFQHFEIEPEAFFLDKLPQVKSDVDKFSATFREAIDQYRALSPHDPIGWGQSYQDKIKSIGAKKTGLSPNKPKSSFRAVSVFGSKGKKTQK